MLAKIELLRLNVLTARIRQQLPREPDGTVGGRTRLIHIGALPILEGDTLLQQREISLDHHHDVVEVVRDPAGQTAHRGQPLTAFLRRDFAA